MTWHKVAERDELADGRVTTVTVDRRTLALTRVAGTYSALDNRCPHQGGPLGEGSIENGMLRCPWHGYDYDPLTGSPPPPFTDAPACFRTALREDGVWVDLPDLPPHRRTVSDVVVESLIAWGVTHVFGMVGHSNLGLADAMRRAEARGELTYIGIRHEGAAAFAASAYGKLTGRPAACFGIAGPGSTNLLTGLYDAKLDQAPVIALSGQVPSKVLGRGAFQDLDLQAAFGDVATYTQTLHSGSNHAELVALAVKHAIDARGVAHLIFPDEVQDQVVGDAPAASRPEGRLADRGSVPSAASLAQALGMIRAARRPVVIVGHGADRAMDAVIDLADALGAPVLTTFKAKGLIPDAHPLAGGVLGRSGTPVASWLMNESDLEIVVGASFANHTGIADYKPIIQIDDDAAAIGRFHAVTCSLLGGAQPTLEILRGDLGTHQSTDQRPDIAVRWAIWRAEKARRLADDRGQGLNSAAVFDALTRRCPPDATICVDVGNNTYSFGRYFEASGQRITMSGYLGSIGFGYPAAMGAWAADPSRPVVAVTGDGGFGQYLAEVTTAVKYGIPIRHVLLVNGALGKITKEQRAGKYDVWQTSLHNPDFAAFAELCGATGIRVDRHDELDAAFARAFAVDGPVIVAITCDAELI
jgi:thiamine pyrophosphate-dependent acetolactate synthase large subunit-like protein/nitrite reductase/ring-hydroxylating ferredoxin subunit